MIDFWFAKIQSLIAAIVSSIFQTDHINISNLLPTVDLSLVLSNLLYGGVALPPSGGVHSTNLSKDSTDLPKDTFAMTTLYKPISGSGGGIRHILDVKSKNFDIRHIFGV